MSKDQNHKVLRAWQEEINPKLYRVASDFGSPSEGVLLTRREVQLMGALMPEANWIIVGDDPFSTAAGENQ